MLGLKTFFTVGTDEVRAWTFKDGMKAPECAGIIHTDFERGFIRAEVMSYEDLINCGSEIKVKEVDFTISELTDTSSYGNYDYDFKYHKQQKRKI